MFHRAAVDWWANWKNHTAWATWPKTRWTDPGDERSETKLKSPTTKMMWCLVKNISNKPLYLKFWFKKLLLFLLFSSTFFFNFKSFLDCGCYEIWAILINWVLISKVSNWGWPTRDTRLAAPNLARAGWTCTSRRWTCDKEDLKLATLPTITWTRQPPP